MKKLFGMAVLALGLVLAGAPAVMAGGASDTSGEGFHCYLFFEEDIALPVRFAQVMVNEEDSAEAGKKVKEFLDKYEIDEDFNLVTSVGNITSPDPARPEICAAIKEPEPPPPPPEPDPLLCYTCSEIGPLPPGLPPFPGVCPLNLGVPVDVADQFTADTVFVGELTVFCNPVSKVGDTATISNPNLHYTCYNVTSFTNLPPVEGAVTFTDQFVQQEVPIFGPTFLCDPADKEGFVFPLFP